MAETLQGLPDAQEAFCRVWVLCAGFIHFLGQWPLQALRGFWGEADHL